MSQNYNQDRRKKQYPIDFDDRRKIPYDYKGLNLSWKQIILSIVTAIIIGLFSFLGANYININKTIQQHTIQLNKIINAAPKDQPQVVVNSELKGAIDLLSGQINNMVGDFSEFKREQKTVDKDFNKDLEKMDETLENMDDTLILIKAKMGID